MVGVLIESILVSAEVPAQSGSAGEVPVSAGGSYPSLMRNAVLRDGFHFQMAFGIGGGPDSSGVFHAYAAKKTHLTNEQRRHASVPLEVGELLPAVTPGIFSFGLGSLVLLPVDACGEALPMM